MPVIRALLGPGRWPLLAALAIGLGILAGVWIVRSELDPYGSAKQAATTYTYARLTQDYSTWWDSVAPACRPASSKSQWVSDIRSGYQTLGVQADPAGTQVQVVSTHGAGDLLQMDVHVVPPSPRRSAAVEVDVQRGSGGCLVVGDGPPGDTVRCGVL